MSKNRSNRAPWSPIINLVPYYKVNGEYYEDNPNGIYYNSVINIKFMLILYIIIFDTSI